MPPAPVEPSPLAPGLQQPCPRVRHGKAARQGWGQLQYPDLSLQRPRFRQCLPYFPNQETKISKLLGRREVHRSTLQALPSKELHTSLLVCPGDVSHQTCICALPASSSFFSKSSIFRMFERASENNGSFYLCTQKLYFLPILNKPQVDNSDMVIEVCWERFSVMDMSNKDDCGCFPAVPYSAVCYTATCTILNLLQVCMGNSPYRIW